MNLRSLSSLAAAAGIWLGGAAAAQEPARLPVGNTAAPLTNQQMAVTVAAQLERGNLRGYTIDVSCKDGIVELSGRVADNIQREEVIRTALPFPASRASSTG